MHSMPINLFRRDRSTAPDPRLESLLRQAVVIGALLVLAVPAARGHSTWLGALPLWLLGMPLASWWSLHRFRLPCAQASVTATGITRRRQPGRAQARRRAPAQARRMGTAHAA